MVFLLWSHVSDILFFKPREEKERERGYRFRMRCGARNKVYFYDFGRVAAVNVKNYLPYNTALFFRSTEPDTDIHLRPMYRKILWTDSQWDRDRVDYLPLLFQSMLKNNRYPFAGLSLPLCTEGTAVFFFSVFRDNTVQRLPLCRPSPGSQTFDFTEFGFLT